jgi:hypothetical protein
MLQSFFRQPLAKQQKDAAKKSTGQIFIRPVQKSLKLEENWRRSAEQTGAQQNLLLSGRLRMAVS